MDSQSVTVTLPEPLYARLARRAEKSRRTVEAELADAVSALPDEAEELPRDLADSIAALQLLDDVELWRAARQNLSVEKASAIEDLHAKRQREGLSASEIETLATLMQEYTRTLLVRSRSAALLKLRGCDVSSLIEANEP
jgi:hypothetical protein